MPKFRDSDAAMYEKLHGALKATRGNISEACGFLNKDPGSNAIKWSQSVVEEILCTDEYSAWLASSSEILMKHAKYTALRRVADPENLGDNAKAMVSLALLRGDVKGAIVKAAGSKEKETPMETPSSDLVEDGDT